MKINIIKLFFGLIIFLPLYSGMELFHFFKVWYLESLCMLFYWPLFIWSNRLFLNICEWKSLNRKYSWLSFFIHIKKGWGEFSLGLSNRHKTLLHMKFCYDWNLTLIFLFSTVYICFDRFWWSTLQMDLLIIKKYIRIFFQYLFLRFSFIRL